MTGATDKYREFWADKTTPLHRRHDQETYRAYAEELKNIFIYFGYAGGKVFEIGCGNGALFPYFGFDKGDYTGIDFSAPMLQVFREDFPGVHLIEGDAATYEPEGEYQLIFGNAVHQHFSPPVLKQHLNMALPKVAQGGVYILANLPYRPLKSRYRNGEFDSERRFVERSALQKLLFGAKTTAIRLRNVFQADRDGIGFWYSTQDILTFVGTNYRIDLLGSNFYAYRQHVIVRHASG